MYHNYILFCVGCSAYGTVHSPLASRGCTFWANGSKTRPKTESLLGELRIDGLGKLVVLLGEGKKAVVETKWAKRGAVATLELCYFQLALR